MKVAVVTSSPPLSEGGHLVIARSLVDALREAGHDAGLMLTPQNRFGRQASAYLATWLTDVGVAHDGTRIDQVISFRFPSYAVRHPRHVGWLNHRMREYYDLWDRFQARCPGRPASRNASGGRAIHRVDTYLLTRRVTRLFAQSATVQGRLRRFGNIRADVLYPPPRRGRTGATATGRSSSRCPGSRRSSASTCSFARSPNRRPPACAARSPATAKRLRASGSWSATSALETG